MSYQKLYVQVLQALPQAVCHCDGQGIIQESNPAAQALLGYAPEALQQTWWLELVHVSDQAVIEDAWQALQSQAEVSACTVRCLRGDAYSDAAKAKNIYLDSQHNLFAYVSVRVTFAATYDETGALEHVLLWLEHNPKMQAADDVSSVINDAPTEDVASKSRMRKNVASADIANIVAKMNTKSEGLPSHNMVEGHMQVGNVQTLQSEPEMATHDQQARQHDRVIARDFYLDTRPAMIAVLDRQGHVVQVSEAAAALVGQPAAEVVGCTLWQVFPKMLHNEAGQAFRRAMETGAPLYYEFVAEDERLDNAWHGVHVIPVADYLVVKIEDLTARKASEQRLVAAKHRAEVLFAQRNAILESISDYFFILNRDYRFVYANQAVLELLEETPQSILNRTVWDVVTLPADNPFRKAYQKAINEQVPQQVRYQSSNPKLTGQTLEIALYPFQGGVIGYSRNVSEFDALRQQRDQALADKEAILNSIGDGVSVLTHDWLYVYANREVRKRRPDILGKHYLDLFPEHRGSVFERKYRQAFDTQQPVFFEAQTAGGVWVEVRVYPAGDSITIYTADISERKQLEQNLHDSNRKLQASEAKFRAFFEDSDTAHFMLNLQDPDQLVERFITNAAFDRLFANTLLADTDRYLTLADYQIISRQLTDDYYPLLELGLQGKDHLIRATKHYLNRDGSGFWADVSSVFVRDEQGEPTLVISTIVDITEQKLTQQALETSETKFRTFFEASLTPLQLIDIDNSGMVEITSNRALKRFLGRDLSSVQRIPQETLLEFVSHVSHPDDAQQEMRWLAEIAAGTRTTYRLEKRYLHPSGQLRWGDTLVSGIRQADGSLLLLTSVQDISQQKRTQEALEASEAKFRNFFERSSVPYTLSIYEGGLGGTGNYLYLYNQAFAELVADTTFLDNLDPTSLASVDQAIDRTTHPEDVLTQTALEAELAQGKRNGYTLKKRYLRRDGTVIWVSLDAQLWHDADTNQSFVITTVYDISQQVHTEQNLHAALEQLEASERKFRTFFEVSTTPLFMYTVSENGQGEWLFNQAFHDFLADTAWLEHDYDSMSLAQVADIITAITHPGDLEQEQYYMDEVLAGVRDGYRIEKRYLNRDGSIIWGDLNTVTVRDEAGNVRLNIAIVQDITQIKQAQQALKTSEARFRAFFENNIIPCNMFLFDAIDKWERGFHFNAAFADFLKDTAFADYSGKLLSIEDTLSALAAIGHPEDSAVDERFVAEVIAGERDSYQFERRYFTRNGSIIWGDVSTVFLRDEQGQPTLGMSIVQDITERKRAEQALKTSEAKFRTFFENNTTPCTMFIFDDDGEWEQGFHFNDAFAAFLKDTTFADHADRLSSVEDTLRALTAIGHPEDNALDEHYVGEVVAGKRDQYHLEKRYFTRDGGVIWGEISSVFVRNEQGELTLGMSIVQDITERKRAQVALEQALEDKDLLLKEVHHRTKNNMQLISSMLALQSRRIADELAKEALVDSSKRINLLANMHRVLYQTTDNDIIDVGEQLSSLVASLTLGFRADVKVDEDIASIYLDVHQAIPLSLIANELLTNAFKHAFPEASSEDTLTVRLQQQDGTAVLEIQDNGVGLTDGYPQDHLGMIIVESLTQQLDATFTLQNLPEGGCLARVAFRQARKQ